MTRHVLSIHNSIQQALLKIIWLFFYVMTGASAYGSAGKVLASWKIIIQSVAAVCQRQRVKYEAANYSILLRRHSVVCWPA